MTRLHNGVNQMRREQCIAGFTLITYGRIQHTVFVCLLQCIAELLRDAIVLGFIPTVGIKPRGLDVFQRGCEHNAQATHLNAVVLEIGNALKIALLVVTGLSYAGCHRLGRIENSKLPG